MTTEIDIEDTNNTDNIDQSDNSSTNDSDDNEIPTTFISVFCVYDDTPVEMLWKDSVIECHYERKGEETFKLQKILHVNSFVNKGTWPEVDLTNILDVSKYKKIQDYTKDLMSHTYTNFDVRDELNLRAGTGPFSQEFQPLWKRTFNFPKSFIPFLKIFLSELEPDIEYADDALGSKNIIIKSIKLEYGVLNITPMILGPNKKPLYKKYNEVVHAMHKAMTSTVYKYGVAQNAIY